MTLWLDQVLTRQETQLQCCLELGNTVKVGAAEQSQSVAGSNFIASALIKSCSRFLDGMVYFSYPSPNNAWRRPGRDAPKVTCVAKILRHRRVFYPFPKYRMSEDVCDSALCPLL